VHGFEIYSTRVSPNDPAKLRFHVIFLKKKIVPFDNLTVKMQNP
jgi:hypothetical protein